MATLNKSQLETLWATVNPGVGDPHLMAAIALAESSGNTTAGNYCCHGLWQVNTLVHPYTIAQMENPISNARAAGAILKSQGLGAWETYTNGSYKQYYTGPSSGRASVSLLGEAGKYTPLGPLVEGAEQGLGNLEGATGGKGLFGVLGAIPGDFDKIYRLLFTPEGWIKLGKLLVGTFLLLSGLMGMANINASPVDIVTKGATRIGAVAA